MDSINENNATNNQYKNIKLNAFNKSINNNFSNSNTSINNNKFQNNIPNFSLTNNLDSYTSSNSQTQIYSRKNISLGDTTVYQPQRIEQINTNMSDQIELKENSYKYRITRVNIDSRNRNTTPKNITSNTNNVTVSNPFTLTANNNIIRINLPNHGLSINDKITITNILGQEFYLRTLEMTQGSNFIKINHNNHGMIPFSTSTNTNTNTNTSTNTNKTYAEYQIVISGITNNGVTYLQNIPLNVLNNFQTVYFNTNNNSTYDVNFYYIKIPLVPNQTAIYNINYKVTYKHLYGIPLSSINSNYPVNADQQNGFQTVNEIIDNNNFNIQTDYIANSNVSSCGGNNISINTIVDYIEGYPNNNHYIISLNKTFYNVSKLRLISTEFPNTDKIIRDSPVSRKNNQIYWQSLGDGDTIYSINITPGNYNTIDLTTEINNQISKVNIINSNIVTTATYNYSKYFTSVVAINTNSNLFTIQFFGTLNIINPFNIVVNTSNNNIYYLEINHPNHLLTVGTQITIQNSTSIGVVPDYVINNVQTITSIIDNSHYIVQLKPFNILQNDSIITSGGGNSVQIIYPFIARLLFNYQGTVGNLLGFRNVGQPNSITQWDYIISNNTSYVNDILTDATGIPITSSVISNYINLNGDNYLIISNPLLKNTVDTGGINGVFAKILLAGPPGYILYNQYIQLGDELNEGIQSLSELEFYFYALDGTLYEFNGLEHSFTIEIYEKIIDNPNINNNSRL